MKILHIIAGAPTGGAETFSTDVMKSLHEQGIEQQLLCRPHQNLIKVLNDRSIIYTPLTFKSFKKWSEQNIIRKKIKEYNPDIIHCWMSRASSFMPANIDIPTLGWFGGYYNLKNYKNCNFYMGVTKDIVRHIIEQTNKPEKSFVVHTFGTLDKDEPIKRSDFDIPESAKTVLLLSRMHWKKGVDTLLEAALQLKDTYFLLAGDGPDQEKYEEMAKNLNLEDRVRFLGWRNDRAALLDIADTCVLPSRYEPFGTVIAESWYAKTPLVATKADGAKQYVTHEKNGLLLEIDDVDDLAKQLRRALNDEKLRETLIKGGTNTYNSLFSKEVVTKSLLDSYDTMLKARVKDLNNES